MCFKGGMQIVAAIERIELKYRLLASVLDERARRHWAASEARAYGWGGVSAVSAATGMSPNTIRKGLAELTAREVDPDAEVTSREIIGFIQRECELPSRFR